MMPLKFPARAPSETGRPGGDMPPGALLTQVLGSRARPEPIRRRTLIALRWVALTGQVSAVLGAWSLGARFPVVTVLLVVALAAAVNLILSRLHRPRITPEEVLAQLVFDTVQTGTLLTLAGGISNPFGLFVLAPLTIGASVLPRRLMLMLAGAVTAMLVAMTALFVPLRFVPDPLLSPAGAIQLGHLLALAIGGAFFAAYAHRVSSDLAATANALTATQLGLAREQRLQHLGGVVAAAAHEMGTPLATIKLVAGELEAELKDRPDIAEDLALLRRSADRCRDILRSMGGAGKDDLHLHNAPLADVLAEAAAPHRDRGARIVIEDRTGLIVHRDAGLIHALRNLIQNAVDFARGRVTVQAERSDGRIVVIIEDDGPGYPPHLLDRLGEPYLTTRRAGGAEGYEGMGLGLFIGRTLLERSGGVVEFFNRNGAVARVSWPEAELIADDREALSANPAISG